MKSILEKYIPAAAVDRVYDLIVKHRIRFKIVGQRLTRHGDYRKNPDGSHQITVNTSQNPYRFLMTTIHEIAHLVAIETYGRNIKPHGIEWKYTFQQLMIPFLNKQVFPKQVLPLLLNHFRNPKASSDTDALLSMELKKFDPPTDKKYIDELPIGTIFRADNGRIFKRGKRVVKRVECMHINSKRIYLFQPNTQVEPLNTNN